MSLLAVRRITPVKKNQILFSLLVVAYFKTRSRGSL